jgi:type III secretion protein Q
MLLNEWNEQDLDLARIIEGGKSTSIDERNVSPRIDSDRLLDAMDGLDTDLWTAPREKRRGADDDIGTGIRSTAGSTAAPLVLRQLPCGGDGVLLSLLVDSLPATAWVDGNAWCDWVAPRLCVQAFEQIPPELVPVLGHWALMPLHDHVKAAGCGAIRFVAAHPGSCPYAMAPVLSMMRDDAELSLRLLDWPARSLASLARIMEDRRVPVNVPPIPVALAAGWSRLTRAQLAALRPGDGIVLDRDARVDLGQAWLVAGNSCARLRFEAGNWHIECAFHEEEVMPELGDTLLEGASLSDDRIVLTVVAEVGRMSLSLDTLRGLYSGQVLDVPHADHGRVALTVSGQAVATGSLLRVGDRLVVRID